MSILLGDLCRNLIEVNHNLAELPVNRIVSDSRKVQPGDLFVAVTGFESDGHQYIDKAVAQGACAVVAERQVPHIDVPILLVENSRATLALLADRFYGHITRELTLVGVTGTNGKTTIAFLVEHFLQSAGYKTGLIGTVMYRYPGFEESAPRTTPDILELHDLFYRMHQAGVSHVVMEVSSHALALHRVEGLTFKGAIFTNLTRDHLDFHQDLNAYGQAKAKLFAMLGTEGVAVINRDDSAADVMLETVSGRAVTYGIDAETVDYKIENIDMASLQSDFTLRYAGRQIPISTRLLGRFNLMNLTAAVVLGLEMGLSEEAIRSAVATAPQIPGRMERLDAESGFRVLVDYAHTPDALQNVLIASREFTRNRLICVFGCGGDRDRGKRPLMGRIAEAFADVVIVTSDNPRTEDPHQILRDILNGMDQSKHVVSMENRKEAIAHALHIAEEGDTIVIAGKGHEPYQEIGKQRFPFDDRLIAHEILEEMGEV